MELHPFEHLRERALQLADTARFNHWEEVGAEMEREGYMLATKRLGSDPILRSMLNARCTLAKDRHG